MQAEIISIGDEILIGQTIDTNAVFIASQLNAIGIQVVQKRTIADTKAAITAALDQILPATSLVFMTGGLGPTNDDITKKTLTDYFGDQLQFNPEVYENIKALFAAYGREPKEVHRQQAFLPARAAAVINKMGTASGMHFSAQGRHYFSMPGVPYEAEHLVRDQIIPWVQENLQKGTVVHKTLLTQGMPESDIAELLVEFEQELPAGIQLAYLPSPGLVKLRLSSYDGNPEQAELTISQLTEKLRYLLGDVVYGENSQSLEAVIGEMLLESNQSLAIAESCTGGSIASRIAAVPGASRYFKGSLVTYATEIKSKVLGVSPDLIESAGVVSEAVAEAMASKVRELLGTDYGVATTGVAGPDGGTAEVPVGSVWIAIASTTRTKAWLYHFGTNRERNIKKASLAALDLLRREIQKNTKE